MGQRVREFQNKCMFDGMLAFMVCGAAILSGTHYPGKDEQLRGLKLLGDAHVHYHANESVESIEVSTSIYTIQLVPGIANIIRCQDGDGNLHVKTCVVAKTTPSKYYPLAEASERHLADVMMWHTYTWRIYQWQDNSGTHFLWACRTDGKRIRGSLRELQKYCPERPEHLSEA